MIWWFIGWSLLVLVGWCLCYGCVVWYNSPVRLTSRKEVCLITVDMALQITLKAMELNQIPCAKTWHDQDEAVHNTAFNAARVNEYFKAVLEGLNSTISEE